MLTRYFSPQRKTWLTSLSVGIIVALLAGSIQFMVIYHNRAERFDAIINNVNTYLKSYFHDLRQTIDGLQPLVDQPCENIDSGLTSHAAFQPQRPRFPAGQKRHRLLLIGYGSHEYAPQPADPGHRYQQTRCYGDFTRHADDAEERGAGAVGR